MGGVLQKGRELKKTRGRNREIRRLVESQNLKVSRLIRTRYGPLNLPSHLKRGQFMEIEKKNLEKIFKMLGMS